jgi:hypothetical protein
MDLAWGGGWGGWGVSPGGEKESGSREPGGKESWCPPRRGWMPFYIVVLRKVCSVPLVGQVEGSPRPSSECLGVHLLLPALVPGKGSRVPVGSILPPEENKFTDAFCSDEGKRETRRELLENLLREPRFASTRAFVIASAAPQSTCMR